MLDAIVSVWKAISPDIFEVCSGYLNWSLEDLSLDAGHSLDEARKIVKENLSARQNPVIVWLLIGLIYHANFCKMCSTPQSFQGNPWMQPRGQTCPEVTIRCLFFRCSSGGKAVTLSVSSPLRHNAILNIAPVLSVLGLAVVNKHHQTMVHHQHSTPSPFPLRMPERCFCLAKQQPVGRSGARRSRFIRSRWTEFPTRSRWLPDPSCHSIPVTADLPLPRPRSGILIRLRLHMLAANPSKTYKYH